MYHNTQPMDSSNEKLTLRTSIIHSDLCKSLVNLVKSGDVPHILIHGPAGSGKTCISKMILSEIYGPDIHAMRLDKKTFETAHRKIEMDIHSSKFHMELSPGLCGMNDIYVLQSIIKEIAQTSSLTGHMTDSRVKYRVIVIRGADDISKQAQSALRMTMEKYTSSCRLILISRKHNNVIEPIRSRCLQVRVPTPCCGSVSRLLSMDIEYVKDVMAKNNGDLKYVMEDIPPREWKLFIGSLASKILTDQSPRMVMTSRDMVHELLSAGVPGHVILETLVCILLDNIDDESLSWEIVKWTSHYEYRLQTGNKELVHIEAFIVKFMCIYKEYSMGEF